MDTVSNRECGRGSVAGKGAGARSVVSATAAIAVAVLVCAGLIRCVDEQNPFADTANARAMMLGDRSGFADSDTVDMFTTCSLYVAVLVSEQVESFTVHVDSNRYFSESLVVDPGPDDYVFPVSFFDTGAMQVTVTTQRRGGDRTVERWEVRSHSPLDIDSTGGEVDGDVQFSTSSVKDSVTYHWAYGSPRPDGTVHWIDTIPSAVWTTSKRIGQAGCYRGLLWVSAPAPATPATVHRSPGKPFTIVVNDGLPPEIRCLNELNGDTIVTGSERFVFMAQIVDGGGLSLVTIDGDRPDSTANIYSRVYESLDETQGTIPVRVWAQDDNGNEIAKIFYIVYEPGAGGQQATRVVIETIGDSLYATSDSLQVRGYVIDYGHSTVYLASSVNGVGSPDTVPYQVAEGVRVDFAVWVRLEEDKAQKVVVSALDQTGDYLGADTGTVYYLSGYVDTDAPRIIDVAVENTSVPPGHLVAVTGDSADIRVRVFDPSGTDSVSLNGEPLTSVDSGYEWKGTVAGLMYHVLSDVRIRAVDALGNDTVFSFRLQKNRPPAMPADWEWPTRLFVNTVYSLQFEVQDEDDGLTTVSLAESPGGMTVRKLDWTDWWAIEWTPAAGDTGFHLANLVLSDTYGEEALVGWWFRVLPDSTALVRFQTTAAELPRLLEAERDTLAVELVVKTGKGTAPFRFTSILTDLDRLIGDTTTTARTVPLRWVPAVTDTGIRHLMVTVRDDLGDTDVLYRDIEVVPPNDDSCRLSWELLQQVDTTADGELDMRGVTEPVGVRFTIHDSDHPCTEQYMRTVSIGGARSVDTLDSAATFTVNLAAVSERVHDTLVVTIADRTGGRDTVLIRMVYPFPVPRPSDDWEWPAGFVGGADYAIPFVVVSPRHAVTLHADSLPGGMVFAPDSAKAWTMQWNPSVADSGEYTVHLRLDDGYQDTVMAWSFTVLPDSSRIVRFAAGSGALPKYIESGAKVESPLGVATGAGHPPLRYTARRLDRPAMLLDSTRADREAIIFTWQTQPSDEGNAELLFVVTDALGFADTVYGLVPVVPPNSQPCSLKVSYSAGARFTHDGALDMSHASGPDTVRFTIRDGDHPLTERYVVYITRDNVTSNETLDTARMFEIVVQPSTDLGYDTIGVVVLDATGTSASKTIRVLYTTEFPAITSATVEMLADADPANVSLVNQSGSLYVNVWEGTQAIFPFTSNSAGLPPPTYDSSGAFPFLHFEPTEHSNLLAGMSRSTWDWVDSAFTIVAVARLERVEATEYYTILSNTDSEHDYLGFGVVDGEAGTFSEGSSDKSGLAVQAGKWYIYVFSSNGRSSGSITVSPWVNGVAGQQTSVTATMDGYHSMVGATSRLYGYHVWDGDIAELSMMRGKITADERRQIELFYSAKYGIPLP